MMHNEALNHPQKKTVKTFKRSEVCQIHTIKSSQTNVLWGQQWALLICLFSIKMTTNKADYHRSFKSKIKHSVKSKILSSKNLKRLPSFLKEAVEIHSNTTTNTVGRCLCVLKKTPVRKGKQPFDQGETVTIVAQEKSCFVEGRI